MFSIFFECSWMSSSLRGGAVIFPKWNINLNRDYFLNWCSIVWGCTYLKLSVHVFLYIKLSWCILTNVTFFCRFSFIFGSSQLVSHVTLSPHVTLSSLGRIRPCELEDLCSWESVDLWTCDLRHLPPTVETAPWDACTRPLRLLLETPPPDRWDCSNIETRLLVETPPPDRWDSSFRHLHPPVETAPW